MNLTEICEFCHNYFPPKSKKLDKSYIHRGNFEISGNSIAPLNFLLENQYFRIVGSVLNDGVYQNNASLQLSPEKFTGEIHEMAIPPDFLKICEEITAWRKINESPDSANMSPYTSESFAGYSYSKGGSGNASNGSGNAVTWQSQFAVRLSPWRKLR